MPLSTTPPAQPRWWWFTGGVSALRGDHRDDRDADEESLGGAQLLERELGASIIEEIKHE